MQKLPDRHKHTDGQVYYVLYILRVQLYIPIRASVRVLLIISCSLSLVGKVNFV